MRAYRLRGERHHRSKLLDCDVRLMRLLNAEGIGYRKIAEKFDCGISTARDICTYRTRIDSQGAVE